MTKADGHVLAIELLRPADWVAEVGATVGGAIQLNIPELGAQDEAQVLAITACPVIHPGRGRVVTGTFKHEVAAGVVQVTLADSTGKVVDRLGATSNHPFWSEDRLDFVPAGQLQANEDVRTHSGDRLRVASVLPRPGPATVYNLEIQGEHAYYVGTHATLVHNACGQQPPSLTGYTRHGLNQAIGRDGYGVHPRAILDAVNNPLSVSPQSGGRWAFVGRSATVVLNSSGKVITTWATSIGGRRMQPIQ